MPADRHDLPALDRLTADVAQAMRAAEAAPRARWWRRLPPLIVVLLALAVPAAIALHGTGHDRTVDVPGSQVPVALAHCEGGATITIGILMTGYGAAGISRRAGHPTAAVVRRACA